MKYTKKIGWKRLTFFCMLLCMLFCAIQGTTTAAAGSKQLTAREQLTAKEQILYDHCHQKMKDVAEGRSLESRFGVSLLNSASNGSGLLTYSAKDLGVSSLWIPSLSGKKYLSEEAAHAMDLQMEKMSERLLLALTADWPEDLYWLDKEQGIQLDYEYQTASVQEEDALLLTSVTCICAISSDYRGAGDTMVDAEKIRHAVAVLAGGRQIVAEAEGKTDLQKLQYYRDRILQLADYEEHPGNQGGVYEIISLFDGDPGTKVVCESYAKAFHYLCSLTTFQADICCLYVDGTVLDRESRQEYPHAWNLVRSAGKNYLVDLTNCDEGTVGEPDQLYMKACASGDVKTGYTMRLTDGTLLTYKYSPANQALYSQSLLALAKHVHDKAERKEKVVSATVDRAGSYQKVTYCKSCKETLSSVKVTVKKLTPTGKWVSSKIRMKRRSRKSGRMFIQMAKGDYVASIASSNKKILRVSATKTGVVTLSAQKKTGIAYVTIKLHSGLKKKMKVTVIK